MSTAVRSSQAKVPPHAVVGNRGSVKRHLPLVCLLWPALLCSQVRSATEAGLHQQKAPQVLAATILALGGTPWLDLKTVETRGRTAAFYQGKPTRVIVETTETTQFPNSHRIDLASKSRVVQIYTAGMNGHVQGWEITYRGKKPILPALLDDYQRWHNHSLATVLRQWFANPATILLDSGPTIVNRLPAEEVTLVSGNGDSIILDVDAESHLPLRLSFSWRDPLFHDKNIDAVEYDNYHVIDGISTPFTLTWTHNGETVRQRYLAGVKYNIALPQDFFDPDRAAARTK